MPASLMFSSAAISESWGGRPSFRVRLPTASSICAVDPLDPAWLAQQQRVAQMMADLALDDRHGVG